MSVCVCAALSHWIGAVIRVYRKANDQVGWYVRRWVWANNFSLKMTWLHLYLEWRSETILQIM